MRTVHSEHVYDAPMTSIGSLDPELLRTFLEVRRCGSMTRAAETLYLSQPAVTRRLARLERALDLRLFERLGKTLHATEAGDALAQEAVELLAHLDRLAESLRARKSGERGRLRIGASTTPGLYVLPRALSRFQEAHPGIELSFRVENSLEIERKILANELDVGFVGAHLAHSAIRLRRLFDDDIALYASEGHPLTSRRVNARELARSLAIVREPGSATRGLVDGWFLRRRAPWRRILEIGCPEAAKPLVRAGVGFSYISARGLEGPGGAGLARIGLADFAVRRPIYVALHAQKALSPSVRAFLRLVAS
jgi:DNA-binding transcriptional LysR family regulator